eukprot:530106-Hanusia_phi.AAC.1
MITPIRSLRRPKSRAPGQEAGRRPGPAAARRRCPARPGSPPGAGGESRGKFPKFKFIWARESSLQ